MALRSQVLMVGRIVLSGEGFKGPVLVCFFVRFGGLGGFSFPFCFGLLLLSKVSDIGPLVAFVAAL